MNTATYAMSALLGAALLLGLPLVIRVVLDAARLYHAAGMARVHNHTRRTHA